MAPGSAIAHYRITAKLGEGGMGEVWRATDTKLNRDVAIKILPEAFAADPDRMARFEREAKVLASLNHPNIAAIYGVEERALVMELVEGETLKGPLPVETAIPYAKQIAEALEAAHEKGVVHRDLKPANIKVTPDGNVKVLDFGVAAVAQASASGSADPLSSPTLTMRATQMGMIMGTAAYMSPEQASGKPVDKRADIWSFGVVLWEMLTGQRLFEGETISHTLADVLRATIDLGKLPHETPQAIRDLLRRCLDRDVKQRLRDIGEARIALEEPLVLTPQPQARPRARLWLSWSFAAALLALAAVSFLFFRERPPEALVLRTMILPPENTTFDFPNVLGLPALSPDGRRIVFGARTADGKTPLWVRPLDSVTAQPLAGTDGAAFPFWSPDSRFIAFFADNRLKKIDASGGAAVTLANAPTGTRGGAWSRDGVIVFAPSPNSIAPLQRVPEGGGAPSPLPKASGLMPWFLPDGKHFLSWYGGGVIRVASTDGGDSKTIGEADTNAAYAQGHLLFLRDGTLMAQPFDTGRLVTTGEAVPIAQEVQTVFAQQNVGVFSVSETGLLVYRTGGSPLGYQTPLMWFDRSGKELGNLGEPGAYNTVALSPDGARVAVDRMDPQAGHGRRTTFDIWLLEFSRGTSTRFTSDPASELSSAWSPDGSRIVFSSNRDEVLNLYQKSSNGASSEELLFKSAESKMAQDWSPDGRFVLYASLSAPGGGQLWVLPMTGDDRKPKPYLQSEFSQVQARFSPDGRWVAYTSNESGHNEIYVRPFPDAQSGKWTVSRDGGSQPRWRRDGKELFYLSADSKMMAVEVTTGPAFKSGTPTALFTAPVQPGATNVTRYDVTADGKKFLIVTELRARSDAAAKPPAPITLMLNWNAGLRK